LINFAKWKKWSTLFFHFLFSFSIFASVNSKRRKKDEYNFLSKWLILRKRSTFAKITAHTERFLLNNSYICGVVQK